MSDSSVRCWLVERTFDDRNLVTTVYATRDGRQFQKQTRSEMALRRGSPVTAAVSIPEEDLEQTPDEETRERYATEADRVASEYDPDDPI